MTTIIEETEEMYDAREQVRICEEELKEKVQRVVLARFRQRKILEKELGVEIKVRRGTWEKVKEWEEEYENKLEWIGVE